MKKKYVIATISAITMMVVLTMLLNPLFLRTENQIRDNLLNLTPIGISLDEVEVVVKERSNWRIMQSSSERGYVNHRYPSGAQTVGDKFITVDLGRSSWLFYVRASWVFDEAGTLINIYVVRATAN